MKRMTRMENWTLFYGTDEIIGSHLVGDVYNHPRFEDGLMIQTTAIKRVNSDGTVETKNTTYALGKEVAVSDVCYGDKIKELSTQAGE